MAPHSWWTRRKLLKLCLRLTGLAVAVWALYGLIKQHNMFGF
jgi:hypothetical protein